MGFCWPWQPTILQRQFTHYLVHCGSNKERWCKDVRYVVAVKKWKQSTLPDSICGALYVTWQGTASDSKMWKINDQRLDLLQYYLQIIEA
jgi:hypothetical protein